MHLVRTGAVEGIEKLVLELGGNPITMIERVGLSYPQFHDPNTYIAYVKLAELLGLCAVECRQPLFGLMLAQRHSVGVLGDLPMIASRAATVEEALEVVGRYLYLHASGVRIETVKRGVDLELRLLIDIGAPFGFDQLMQLSVAHLAFFAASLLGTDAYGLPIRLQQAGPAGQHGAETLRFSRLRFSGEYNGICLPVDSPGRRTQRDEAALTAHLEGYLKDLQARYPGKLLDQVMDIIGRLLPSGECSLEHVAGTLDMHPRTLQARLKHEGTSYRTLLQQTRMSLAAQHLRGDTSNITELALQLGYAELAVFSRHFKHWTGLSPTAWQRAARQAGKER